MTKKTDMTQTGDILARITDIIEARKSADPMASYVAQLFTAGTQKMAQKVGEEGVEVAIAATAGDTSGLASESADLLFHLMVLLAHKGLSLNDIANILAEREGLSGIAEKAGRPQ